MSVSITELKQEVGNLRFVVFFNSPLNTQWDIGYVALPKASTRCQPYLERCFRLPM